MQTDNINKCKFSGKCSVVKCSHCDGCAKARVETKTIPVKRNMFGINHLPGCLEKFIRETDPRPKMLVNESEMKHKVTSW